MSRLPRIGITPDINDRAAPETEYVIRRNYADAVSQAGGLPLVLPYGNITDEYLDAIDGLVVTGGMFDLDPALYCQTARKPYVMKPARTQFEKALIENALQRQMPILGICNGMQLLAVCLGGQLMQDIPTDVDGALEHKPEQSATIAEHAVEIIARPRHLACPEGTYYAVNSVHHQAVLPSEAYKPIAVSPDGVIEAVEANNGGFAVGVQWHPEYGVNLIDEIIWNGFLAAAKEYSLANR